MIERVTRFTFQLIHSQSPEDRKPQFKRMWYEIDRIQ